MEWGSAWVWGGLGAGIWGRGTKKDGLHNRLGEPNQGQIPGEEGSEGWGSQGGMEGGWHEVVVWWAKVA